jgi:Pentapeptide repeats (8 copies)
MPSYRNLVMHFKRETAEEREDFNSLLLALIALFTLAMAPVLTLLVMQLKFLPYHHFGITWLHRGLIFLDMMLVFMMWRGYRYRRGRAFPKAFYAEWRRGFFVTFLGVFGAAWKDRKPRWLVRAMPLVFAVFGTLWLSLWEGRWAGEPWIDPTQGNDYRLLINSGLVRDRLSLPNETIVGGTLLLEKQKEATSGGGRRQVYTRDFRGRNFAYANFSGADLRGVNLAFNGETQQRAVLTGANLNGAEMQESNLNLAYLEHDGI